MNQPSVMAQAATVRYYTEADSHGAVQHCERHRLHHNRCLSGLATLLICLVLFLGKPSSAVLSHLFLPTVSHPAPYAIRSRVLTHTEPNVAPFRHKPYAVPFALHATANLDLVEEATAQLTPSAPGPTLLVSFLSDAASVSMTKALKEVSGPWEEAGVGLWRQGSVLLWELAEYPLAADHIDDRLVEMTGSRPSEVIFLSRHKSATCLPALCVHPIGLPDPTSNVSAGGRPGQCPPPATRLAATYRMLRTISKETKLDNFEVTFEATHHGPWLTTPAMFVEVGSCENQWGNPDAALVWARTLQSLLGLGGHQSTAQTWSHLSAEQRGQATVVMVLGGGHYHPAACDIAAASGSDLYLGHLLASYSLGDVNGHWREAVQAALDATRAAFPGCGQLVAFVNKKNFKATHRDQLLWWLQERGVPVVTSKKDLLRMAGY